MGIEIIFSIAILIMSVVIHEVAHGFAADHMGDPTPRLQGRLSLNPLKHLDWFGSLLIPLLTYQAGGFIFGWAKPVMINPYNLRGRWGEAIVALAGPGSNIIVAIFFGLIFRFGPIFGFSVDFLNAILSIVIINLILAVFNLMPIPPLDGSRVVYAIFPSFSSKYRNTLEGLGFLLVVVFVIIFSGIIVLPIVNFLLGIVAGI